MFRSGFRLLAVLLVSEFCEGKPTARVALRSGWYITQCLWIPSQVSIYHKQQRFAETEVICFMVVADQCSLCSCLLHSLQKYNQFVWQMRENPWHSIPCYVVVCFSLARLCPQFFQRYSCCGWGMVLSFALGHWGLLYVIFFIEQQSVLVAYSFQNTNLHVCCYSGGGRVKGCGLKRLGKFGCFGLESLMGGGGILQWESFTFFCFVFVISENESLLAPFRKQVCVWKHRQKLDLRNNTCEFVSAWWFWWQGFKTCLHITEWFEWDWKWEKVITDMSGEWSFECCFNELIRTVVTVNHIVLEFVFFFYVFFSSSLKKKIALNCTSACVSVQHDCCELVSCETCGYYLHWMSCASLVSLCSSGPVQCVFVSVMAAVVITVSVTAAVVMTVSVTAAVVIIDPSVTGLDELGWLLVGVAILRVTHQNHWSQKQVAVWWKAINVWLWGQITHTCKYANISGVLWGEKGCSELT